jgi:ribosome-associated heat shock protein Hsp15
MRGPAPVAQQLYEETAEAWPAPATGRAAPPGPEPADALPAARRPPTKRDRRSIDQVRSSWGERWSASLDDLKR